MTVTVVSAVVQPSINRQGPGWTDGKLEESVELGGEDLAVYHALATLVKPRALFEKADHLTKLACVRGYKKEKPRAEATGAEVTRILEWREKNDMDRVRLRAVRASLAAAHATAAPRCSSARSARRTSSTQAGQPRCTARTASATWCSTRRSRHVPCRTEKLLRALSPHPDAQSINAESLSAKLPKELMLDHRAQARSLAPNCSAVPGSRVLWAADLRGAGRGEEDGLAAPRLARDEAHLHRGLEGTRRARCFSRHSLAAAARRTAPSAVPSLPLL